MGTRSTNDEFNPVCSLSELEEGTGKPFIVNDRQVAVFLYDSKIYCVDNHCYHNGGPLHMGDIEDLHGRVCITCPWHRYIIDAETGDGIKFSRKLCITSTQTRSNKQRVHEAKVTSEGQVLVRLCSLGTFTSDSHYLMDDGNNIHSTAALVNIRIDPPSTNILSDTNNQKCQ